MAARERPALPPHVSLSSAMETSRRELARPSGLFEGWFRVEQTTGVK